MALGYYLWVSDYKHALGQSVFTGKFATDLPAKVEIDYLEFSIGEGSLTAFRKFNDFFAGEKIIDGKKKRQSDDIFVTDFFPNFPVCRFLKDSEVIQINKTVAHLTSFTSPAESDHLNIIDITGRFIDVFSVFCEYVVKAESTMIPDDIAQIAEGFSAQLTAYKSTLNQTHRA
jgi:hypothetical protein